MNIRRLDLKGFTSHDDTTVELPERGLVLVTGPNGSGKSSVVEGVAWACWGETLRGAPPWRSDDELCRACVSIAGRDLPIERVRKKGKTILSWSESPYETATKAQDALESVLGTFDVWRRSSAFSSADASHFTLATDSERKRLLETILGIDRFDTALDACRVELRQVEKRAAELEQELAVLAERRRGAQARLAEAKKALAELPPKPDINKLALASKEAADMVAGCDRDLAPLRARLRAADCAGESSMSEATHLEQKLRKLAADACPTCEQPILPALRNKLGREVKQLRAAAEKEEAEAKRAVAGLESQIAELNEEQQSLRRLHQEHGSAYSAARYACDLRSSAERVLATAAADLAKVDAVAPVADLAVLVASAAELSACSTVLGLRGVRAQLLGRALLGIEKAANSWLARVASPGLRLHLRPHVEKKSGGVSDAIGLEIEGAGQGRGYQACSGGERRRIDLAVMLALAEVAAAAHGREPGTLFFDEVFDALDADGADAVSSVLHDLAAERAVVVVSHSAELAEALRPSSRLRVESGRVQTT